MALIILLKRISVNEWTFPDSSGIDLMDESTKKIALRVKTKDGIALVNQESREDSGFKYTYVTYDSSGYTNTILLYNKFPISITKRTKYYL